MLPHPADVFDVAVVASGRGHEKLWKSEKRDQSTNQQRARIGITSAAGGCRLP